MIKKGICNIMKEEKKSDERSMKGMSRRIEKRNTLNVSPTPHLIQRNR